MAREPEEFSYESIQDCTTIVAHLNALAAGFAHGRVSFVADHQQLALEPRGLLSFRLKVDRRSRRVKLTIKVSWKDEPEEVLARDPLTITPER
ncbi:MAG: hypothetical protein CHACPFDD_01095 [Phycisphaerae bacterium]|nr:hypothetical protein [Phycisphaerae bacterium]